MHNHCSQCSKNKTIDDEIGGNLSCMCQEHGVHSPANQACADFEPSSIGYIQDTKDKRVLKMIDGINDRDSDNLKNPMLLITIAMFAILFIAFLPAIFSVSQAIFASLLAFTTTTMTVSTSMQDLIGMFIPLVLLMLMLKALTVFTSN